MPKTSPVLRIAIGLILLTVSLLLIGDLLGLTPDARRAELTARKAIAEALAVQVSTQVSQGRTAAVAAVMQTLQERNTAVVSIGLRTGDGRLVAMAGDHLRHWAPIRGERSTPSQVRVPIHGEAGRWGVLEVKFEPFGDLWGSLRRGDSIASVILFVAVTGFAAYWLFLKRALHELDPSAVIPDRVRAALDVLTEGLVVLDRNGRVVLVNAAFERALNQSRDSLLGRSLGVLAWQPAAGAAAGSAVVLPWLSLLESGNAPPPYQLRLQTQTRDWLSFAVNCSAVKGPDGRLRGAVVTFDDLTDLERKNSDLERALERLKHSQREITRQNRELQVLATRDPLTGVLNRRSLFEGMNTLMSEAAGEGSPLSCIMVDIDHFKSINDRFGHATGDKVIKLLARILTDAVRPEDLVGRYGGEEFCIALPGLDEAQAAVTAETIRAAVSDGRGAEITSALRLSASFGVATSTTARIRSEVLVDRADRALYQAKESGRNRVVAFSAVDTGDAGADAVPPADTSTAAAPAAAPPAAEREPLQQRVAGLESLLARFLGGDGGETQPGQAAGLSDGQVLFDRIRQAIQRSSRSACGVAVLAVDVDAVNVVRTTHGSAAASKLMQVIGERLRGALRAVDTVSMSDAGDIGFSLSRIGDGEFAILLSDLKDTQSTTWIVQRLFSMLDATVEIEGNEVLLDARIGASLYPEDGDDPDDLLSHAAAALREAQATCGRRVCVYYSKAINQRSREQLQLESQLHRALERGELFLEYQPSVDMRTGRIAGFEALLRWQHAEWGLVRPDRFIEVAEHAGLIDDIGDWVVATAARQLKVWHELGCDELSMAINFSPIQLRRTDLVDRVVSTLERVDLAPSALVVEITESALIQNLETAVQIVNGLSAAGLSVALDDFGTGYSSLSYLRRFPIDVLKIDRSFLRDFPTRSGDTEIVSAIIAMAHSLGLRVVAEGVETGRQLQVLQNLHCDEIQGYLFSTPISRERATLLLQNPTRIRRMVNAGNRPAGNGEVTRPSAIAGVVNCVPPHRRLG